MRLGFVLFAALAPMTAFAVDGVVLINQANAAAGNVTPGDTPGFPVVISQPGSYKLSSNLTITDPQGIVIQITADNVTVDLNGFTILGPSVCNGHGSVPTTTCTVSNTQSTGIDAGIHVGIKILNGYIRGMGFVGIVCLGDAHVEGINASLNASAIQASGVIIHNIMNYNLFVGLNGDGIVRENEANGNNIGFLSGGVVANNTADFNSNYGFLAQESATILSGNSAKRNTTGDFFVVCPSTVVGNSGTITFNGPSTGCVLANNSN